MRTRWGASNSDKARVWFNLEMAKTAPACWTKIVLRETVPLIERHHNDRFIAVPDRRMPSWREYR